MATRATKSKKISDETTVDEANAGSEEAPLYDAKATQQVGLTINGIHSVVHEMAPLPDERFFKLADDLDESENDASAVLQIKNSVWEELCKSASGYKDRPDWRKSIPIMHRVTAADALRGAVVIKVDDGIADGVFDIDAPIRVGLMAVFNDAQLETLAISFRQPTKADIEEFLAIQNNEPEKNALASAAAPSISKRLYRLGKKLLVAHEGYAGQPPAAHVNTAVGWMLLTQMAAAKKSIA